MVDCAFLLLGPGEGVLLISTLTSFLPYGWEIESDGKRCLCLLFLWLSFHFLLYQRPYLYKQLQWRILHISSINSPVPITPNMWLSFLPYLLASTTLIASRVSATPPSKADARVKNSLLIDTFENELSNSLGLWHGTGEALIVQYGKGYADFFPTNADQNYHTLVSPDCLDLTDSAHALYLHIQFEGTDKFSVSLNQNNEQCSSTVAPYPETWDTIEVSRYSEDGHIYVPISHFGINLKRVSSVSFHGFYTSQKVRFYKVEFVSKLPKKFEIPEKLPNGELVLKCKRPNSFAFGVDDGVPWLAQEVMKIFEEEDILVTFFTVGNALDEPGNNFTNVYTEMLGRGHQVALHTYSHPM